MSPATHFLLLTEAVLLQSCVFLFADQSSGFPLKLLWEDAGAILGVETEAKAVIPGDRGKTEGRGRTRLAFREGGPGLVE